MLALNRIYHQDCLEGMTGIADKSIDMILCDLPYGTTANKWDCQIPLDRLWEQYERIIKDSGCIALTAQIPFTIKLGASNLKLLRYKWVWDKIGKTGFLQAKKSPLKQHEDILIFYKKLPTYNPIMEVGKPYARRNRTPSANYGFQKCVGTISNGERYPSDLIRISCFGKECNGVNRVHPTQKPVALFEYLIKTYTNEGETVLDNCIGSGTTAIACINTNRNFIGFETESKYVEIANKRIQDAMQLKAA